MEDRQTMIQATIFIDGVGSLLAQEQDLGDLRRRIEEAVASAGRFVDFVVVGNCDVAALITATTRVMISVATVQFDPRDTGDTDSLYGGLYDFNL